MILYARNYEPGEKQFDIIDAGASQTDIKSLENLLKCSQFDYAVTITIATKHVKHFDTRNTKLIVYILSRLCRHMAKKCEYDLIIIPELTNKGIVHWHGFLKMPDIHRKNFYRWLTRNIGYCYIRTLRSQQKWFEYCRKEYDQLQKTNNKYRIVRICDKNMLPSPPSTDKQK